MLDNTDRNRTSPFAFTGNKFEFRAVGSSANCANAMTALNTIMAETLKNFKTEVDGLIEKGEKKEIAIMHIIQKYIVESKNVLFEGDGYSEEWAQEAEKRGLPNVKTTPLALDAMLPIKQNNCLKTIMFTTTWNWKPATKSCWKNILKKYRLKRGLWAIWL